MDKRDVTFPLKAAGLLGPDGEPPAAAENARWQIDGAAFEAAVRDVRDFVRANGRVPARVFVGADAWSPADFLVGVARVWRDYLADGYPAPHRQVRLGRGTQLIPARAVAKDAPGVFGGWVIHREGFRAPKVLDVARLQAWTLKPALLPALAPRRLRAQVVPIRTTATVDAGTRHVPLELPGIRVLRLPPGRVVLTGPDGRETVHEIKPIWMTPCETTLSEYAVFAQGLDLSDRERREMDWRGSRVRQPYMPPDFGAAAGGPIGCVTLEAARRYCAWLSGATGRPFRLPTEAEWEYACRAGGRPVKPSAKDLADVAWFADNSEGQPQTVGRKEPNAWGFYDMLGNVAEYVVRDGGDPKGLTAGGSYKDQAKDVHSGAREAYSPDWQKDDEQDPKDPYWLRPAHHVGFRVVMEE
jgi:hypothetical protein